MNEQDPLNLWRLAADLSVEDAAILIAGGDPSNQDSEHEELLDQRVFFKRTTGHTGFTAAFTALKSAVQREQLKTLRQFKSDMDEADGREPDWTKTMIDVDDLKNWLRGRGFTSGFFFPAAPAEISEFLDPNHDHFAPELALAVAVWNALSSQQRFPFGPKAAIKNWIAENPNAWNGKEPLSNAGMERIATLVNWQSIGGAPRTGT